MRVDHGVAPQRNDVLTRQSVAAVTIMRHNRAVAIDGQNYEYMVTSDGGHAGSWGGPRKPEPISGEVQVRDDAPKYVPAGFTAAVSVRAARRTATYDAFSPVGYLPLD
jgi:hypothetical protein